MFLEKRMAWIFLGYDTHYCMYMCVPIRSSVDLSRGLECCFALKPRSENHIVDCLTKQGISLSYTAVGNFFPHWTMIVFWAETNRFWLGIIVGILWCPVTRRRIYLFHFFLFLHSVWRIAPLFWLISISII